jgi:thermolysin
VAATDVRALSEWTIRIEQMLQRGELSVRWERDDTMRPGRQHQRLRQLHRGVPVWGGELVRQVDGPVTVSVFGTVYERIGLEVAPRLSAARAAQVVRGLGAVPHGRRAGPELCVLPQAEGYALAWRVRAFAERTGVPSMYFVDAGDGRVLLQYRDLHTQSAVGLGTGVLGDRKKMSAQQGGGSFVADDALRPPSLLTHDLQGDVFRVIDFLNGAVVLGAGDLARDSDNTWTDGANVDAHTHAGWTYDYYFNRFGRRGLDDNDYGLTSIAHPASRSEIFQNLSIFGNDILLFYLNAAYFGDGLMIYGEGLPPDLVDGLGRQWNFTSGALDIVAHELTHGVTDFSSQLIYQGESGALNEAFSDIMAAGAEFFFQSPGSGLLHADYLVGEDVITPGGLRSMANPQAYGDPDHYSRRFLGAEDNGGVHINSGIVNQAFYLAIEGGSNRTSGLSVSGVGGANREQIEKVFYRAFVLMLPPSASFSTARAATIQAARDLYNAGSPAEGAVIQAWNAVGVQ